MQISKRAVSRQNPKEKSVNQSKSDLFMTEIIPAKNVEKLKTLVEKLI